jgi:hypothetical protein
LATSERLNVQTILHVAKNILFEDPENKKIKVGGTFLLLLSSSDTASNQCPQDVALQSLLRVYQ